MPDLGGEIWILAAAIAALAGFVKGVVGFAMPMIMISGLAMIVSPDLALAMLMIPTVATNLWQAARGGLRSAITVTRKHWRYVVVLWAFILFSAQLVYVLPEAFMFLILGVPVTVFAILQLMGYRLRFPAAARRKVELVVASFSGFVGGLSGVWGPPTVLYLTALETPKFEQVQIQGVIYGSGALMLMVAHVNSGLLTLGTGQLSLAMLIPAVIGMAVGFKVQDRLNQALFRQATLVVLIVAGLNLVRRGLIG